MNFKNDDKLNREKYSEFLLELLDNYDRYKRQSDSQAFSLAIDSSWGTGKTTFLDMFSNNIKIKDNLAIVIKYSAWENDFWENPFETLMSTILSNEVFNIENDKNNLKILAKDFKDVAIDLGKSILKKQLSKIADSELLENIDNRFIKSRHYANFYKSKVSNYDFFEKYEQYYKNLKELKEILTKICNKHKMIILIDELDRCKPTFAINMLEIVKHIFDVKNMIFVFALDIQQLSYSIQTMYGEGMDSPGYLCRFFDYISKMPKPDTDIYIDYITSSKKIINYNLEKPVAKKHEGYILNFTKLFKDFTRLYNLSLRDINTIYSNFLLLEQFYLKDNLNIECYSLYLLLLIMKYKDYNCFYNLFINSKANLNLYDEDFIQKFIRAKLDIDLNAHDVITDIIDNTIISKKENFRLLDQSITEYERCRIVDIAKENKIIQVKYGLSNSYTTYIKYDNKINFSNILFYSDIDNWNEIKKLSIKDFLHRKLELFNFDFQQDIINEVSN